jgi:myo-inositol-1(or 4)-monophosphatase
VFARIGAGVRREVAPVAGTEAGRKAHRVGAGGDTTVEVDRVAEGAVFAELGALAELGERFSVLSEEAGHRDFGARFPLVLVDPVDGSLNAKQGVPLYGLMLAVLEGPTLADTTAGLVMNLATGETWTAVRGHGVWRGGDNLAVLARSRRARIELLGLESTPRSLRAAHPLVERAAKIRILGSMALSIVLTASGALDVFCAPIPVRVFDTAASLLVLREAGGTATSIDGRALDGLRCDLSTRTTLLCASSPELHAEALAILGSSR